MSKPVVDFYRAKNKVIEIDGGKDQHQVWEATKKAVSPL
jgi:adenylate kinase family enzyme